VTSLTAGAPLETPILPVGRRTITLADVARDQRRLDVDLWYPAAPSREPRSVYEVLPGIAFAAAHAQHQPEPAVGRFPLVLMSHGRTGMRISYSMMCEALAARGAVVASADHPGDALLDWLTGRHVDDRTNEVNRVGDAHLVLDALLHGHEAVPSAITSMIHHERVALAGHSYGAFTAFATAAGSRGIEAHERVGAVIGFQPYMRSMSDRLLSRLEVPSLLVVGELDTVTPAHIDSDRAWALLSGRPSWKLDLAGAGHQAVSDIALYAELAAHITDLPEIVRNYLDSTVAGSSGPGTRPWRSVMVDELAAAWAFLQVALGIDAVAGDAEADRLAAADGLTLHRR
jgi:predicted dienelactone hydrolase